MSESWVRLWSGATTDPKWQTIARKSGQPRHLVIALFVHLMLIANDANVRGDVDGLSIEDAASAMDCDEEQVEAIISAMQGRVISDGRLSGWDARQIVRQDAVIEGSKPGAQRVREHRQRMKNGDVTRSNACNADVTRSNAPEAEAEADTESEADQKQTPAQPASSEVDARPEKPAAVAAVRFDPIRYLLEHGADQQTADDYIAQRQGKKAASSHTALRAIVSEAEKARLPLQAALELCCARGWVGFKAEWADQQARAGPPAANSGKQARINNYWQQADKERRNEEVGCSTERDITGESVRIA